LNFKTGTGQKEENESQEIQHIAGIEHATAHRRKVRVNAQIDYRPINRFKKRQLRNGIEAEITEKAKKECQNKGNELVLGER
jgi:hypothetical protein